jgi:ribosomal protein S16
MKNRSKRKPLSLKIKLTQCGMNNHQAFKMLVNSLNETRDEEILVRMLRN